MRTARAVEQINVQHDMRRGVSDATIGHGFQERLHDWSTQQFRDAPSALQWQDLVLLDSSVMKAIGGGELAKTYMNKGTALCQLRQLSAALAAYDRAISLYASLGTDDRADVSVGRSECIRKRIALLQLLETQPEFLPGADYIEDPNFASLRNITYQNALACWNSLPWWSRLRTPKPEPPRE